jgi:transposase
MTQRTPRPTDVSDEESALLAQCLTLMAPDAPQRAYPLREEFSALHWMVRAGAPWRTLSTNFPPWPAVYRQTRRWIDAGTFEAAVHDLRALLRLAAGHAASSSACVLDSRTLQSTLESDARSGYDGAKRRRETKTHVVVDILSHLLALHVTPAKVQDRSQVEDLVVALQAATGAAVEVAFADQGYTGHDPADDTAAYGMRPHVVRLPDSKKGLVLLPRRWVAERTFAWLARARGLARNHERLPRGAVGLHFAAFLRVIIHPAVATLTAGG